MTIYSLYIYDRHCQCIYYQDWHRTKRPKPAVEGNIFQGVARAVTPLAANSNYNSPRNTLSSASGVVIAVNEASPNPPPIPPKTTATAPMSNLPFDEEAKLVYGVIFSLKNMVQKLSGKDEGFVNFRTSTYKLHLYETLSGYKFVLLSDPGADSLKFVLRQIYTGPFLEYVVRNPLIKMDSKEQGIDNEHFRLGTDRLVKSLTVFARS